MTKITKMVANKRSITRTIASSADVNEEVLGEKLEQILFNGQPPHPLTVSLVIRGLVGKLQEGYDVIEDLDREVATEVGQDRVKRGRRDGYAARLRQRLLSLRGSVEADFGSAAVAHLGLRGTTPENPDQLITHSQNVLRQVREGLADFEPLLPDIERPDLTSRAAGIEQDIVKLQKAVDDLQKDVRETQDAQNKRNQATQEWSKTYSPVASIIENLYRLADMPSHADRVRPTNRRRAGLPEPVDIENEPVVDDVIVEEDVVLDI
ncbi:MAG: hypothetical protein ACNA8W_08290 [Bradymonadaceae bacterium]